MVRKCKTTSYDMTDPFEIGLLEFAEKQGKYSKYVKRLIEQDKRRVEGEMDKPIFDDKPSMGDGLIRKDAMKSFF